MDFKIGRKTRRELLEMVISLEQENRKLKDHLSTIAQQQLSGSESDDSTPKSCDNCSNKESCEALYHGIPCENHFWWSPIA